MNSANSDENIGQTPELTRREALVLGAAATPLLGASLNPASATEWRNQAVGPLLGHVDHETAMIWYRPAFAWRIRRHDHEREVRRDANGEGCFVGQTRSLCDMAVRQAATGQRVHLRDHSPGPCRCRGQQPTHSHGTTRWSAGEDCSRNGIVRVEHRVLRYLDANRGAERSTR